MNRRRFYVTLLLLVVLLLAAGPGPICAAAPWSDGERVNDLTTGDQANAAIAMGPLASRYVVWEHGGTAIRFSLGPRGNSWPVTSAQIASGSDLRNPDIAVDAEGNAYAVWQYEVSGNYHIGFAYRPVDGSWTTPTQISAASNSYNPAIAVDGEGNALAAWLDGDPSSTTTNNHVAVASRPAGGSWGSPAQVVSDSRPVDSLEGVDIAQTPYGQGHLVWAIFNDPADDSTEYLKIYGSYRPAGGSWGTAAQITSTDVDGADDADVSIAVDAGTFNYAHAAWAATIWPVDGPNYDIQPQYARRSPAGSWSGAVDVPVVDPVFVKVAVSAGVEGSAFVGFSNGWVNGQIGCVVRSAGAWGSLMTVIDGSGTRQRPGVAVQGATAHMVWEEGTLSGDTEVFYSTYAPPQGLAFEVGNNGDVYAEGSYLTPAADLAEAWPVAGSQPQGTGAERQWEAGDLLALGSGGSAMLAGAPGAGPVLGVYAAQPGFLGGGPRTPLAAGGSRIPVALVGIVPLKVSAEGGAIRPGDLLALSSVPGVAARAEPVSLGGRAFYLSGTFFAKALEPFDSPEVGTVRVLLIGQ